MYSSTLLARNFEIGIVTKNVSWRFLRPAVANCLLAARGHSMSGKEPLAFWDVRSCLLWWLGTGTSELQWGR